MPLSELFLVIAALIIGLVGGALAIRALKVRQRQDEGAVAVRALEQRLDVMTAEMNRTFAQALQQATQSLNGTIGSVRDETRAVREETRAAIQQQSLQVTQTLGDLKATNSRILEQSRSLDEFQRMLQSPKLRGDFGEFTLEQMLARPAAGRAVRDPGVDRKRPRGRARPHAVRRAVHRLQVSARQLSARARGPTEPAARDAAMKQFYSDVRGRIEGNCRSLRAAAGDARRGLHVRAGRERLLRSHRPARAADLRPRVAMWCRFRRTRCTPTFRRWPSASAA